jgi:hypothetical protein
LPSIQKGDTDGFLISLAAYGIIHPRHNIIPEPNKATHQSNITR